MVIWRLFSVRPGHDRLAVLAVAFWCLLPSAPVLQVAYTEALAALLLSGTLLLLVRRHYLWAVPVVLLLGLTRAVAATLVLVVLCHGWLRWRARASDPYRAREVGVLERAAGGHRRVDRAVAGHRRLRHQGAGRVLPDPGRVGPAPGRRARSCRGSVGLGRRSA